MSRIGFALASVMPIRDLMEMSAEAERLGYESVWLTEAQGKDVFTPLAAIATVTRRITLGPTLRSARGQALTPWPPSHSEKRGLWFLIS